MEEKKLTYNYWRKNLKKIPKQEQADWIKRTLKNKKNLHIFGRYFFPHIIKGTEDVPECHLSLLEAINSTGHSGIIFPRGHAKSTWIKLDTIHDIVYGTEPVILYIGNTLTDAGFHFEGIKTELENNDLLHAVFGDLVPPENKKDRKWTNKHFETINGINAVARGAGKGRGVNIKNQRPTKIVCDDIEDDEEVRKAERRQKLHEWLYNVIFNSLDAERGKIKLIGTVLHQEAEILQFYKKFGGIFRKAIEDKKSIWPAIFSMEKLDQIREDSGTRSFAQEYMNEPTNDELANFNPLWIDDNNFTELPEMKNFKKVIFMDPQAGESATADEWCITVLKWARKDRHRYVIEQKAGRCSQTEQAKEVIKTWIEHPEAHVVGVEKVMNQTAVFQNIMSWKSGELDLGLKGKAIIHGNKLYGFDKNIPIKGTRPKAIKDKFGSDKLGRLQALEPMFERGEVHLRPEMRKTRDQILFLGLEVLEHDDRCLSGDSLIATPFGDKKIKDIKVGDRVLTPLGIQKVTAWKNMGEKEVINFGNLICTADHPIFNNKEFANADTIVYTTDICKLSIIKAIEWKYREIFILMNKICIAREKKVLSI